MERADCTIRPCRPEDVPALVALEARWLAEGSTTGMVAVDAEEVRGWLGRYCWLAEQEGTVIGFAAGSIHTSEGLAVIPAGEPGTRSRVLRLDELYVVPERRRQGVGGRLVDRLLAEAAVEGISRGRVYSSSRDWRRIVDFYQRHGYRMWYVELYR